MEIVTDEIKQWANRVREKSFEQPNMLFGRYMSDGTTPSEAIERYIQRAPLLKGTNVVAHVFGGEFWPWGSISNDARINAFRVLLDSLESVNFQAIDSIDGVDTANRVKEDLRGFSESIQPLVFEDLSSESKDFLSNNALTERIGRLQKSLFETSGRVRKAQGETLDPGEYLFKASRILPEIIDIVRVFQRNASNDEFDRAAIKRNG